MKTVFGHNSLFFAKLVSGLIPLLAVLAFYFKPTSAGTRAQSPAPGPAAAI